MRKTVSILMIFTLLLSFAACSNHTNHGESSSPTLQSSKVSSNPIEEPDNQNHSSELSTLDSEPTDPIGESNDQSSSPESSTLDFEPTETDAKSLVVFFSWSGNTKNVAEAIQTQTHSDIFEIIPETPYCDDYDAVLDLAQEEQRNNARPAISGNIENMDQYDVIYVGYPNWWGDMPMILYTFFDSYDLSGKTIAPFCTSGGSGLSDTVNDIKELAPNATVTDGLHIGSSSASDPNNAVSDWLSEIGL